MIRTIRRTSAVLLSMLVMAVVAGCGGGEPTAPALRPDGLRVGAVAQAVWAPTVYQEGTFSRRIGPEGGTLYFGVGSLSFPRGALATTTTITAAVDGVRVAVDFGPEGLSFPSGARPTLGFQTGLNWSSSDFQILYLDGAGRILSLLPTTWDPSSGQATTRLDHFSPYILAQN